LKARAAGTLHPIHLFSTALTPTWNFRTIVFRLGELFDELRFTSVYVSFVQRDISNVQTELKVWMITG
jgi:hypothetical protein